MKASILWGVLLGLTPSIALGFTRLNGPFDDSEARYTLINNGAFESASGTTLTGFTHENTTGSEFGQAPQAGIDQSSAAGLLNSNYTNEGPGMSIWQSIAVTPGERYVLSGYIKNALEPNGQAYLDLADIQIPQSDGGQGDCSAFSSSGLNQWQFVYCEFTVPDGLLQVRYRAVIDNSIVANSQAYFDEMALTRAGDFHPPESLSQDDDGDGYSEIFGDCNDDNAQIHPGATEICGDGIDNDCENGDLHCDDHDSDGDGFTENQGDCNDQNQAIHPDASEICGDGLDNDCQGGDLSCSDVDNDGDGFTENQGDCNDQNPAIHPDADETCNGLDDDCDERSDEGVMITAYADDDGDGFGDGATQQSTCTIESGWSANDADCDDQNAGIHPNASESCDDLDQDCDGAIDEGTLLTQFIDEDGDGYGQSQASSSSCTIEDGYAAQGGDCDDNNAEAYPAADEQPYDGVDQDCDGQDLVDVDGDGFVASQVDGGDDCNDDDETIHPDGQEIPYDSVDQDCSGADLVDVDGDGYASTLAGGDDCDDEDPNTYPGASEFADENDNDCDDSVDEGLETTDDDGDGFSEADGDCNDDDAAIHPEANEDCDGVDNDCDALIDEDFDTDGDGYLDGDACGDDCDDGDENIHPDATEIEDDVDNDCDDRIDEGTSDFDDDGDGYSENDGDCDDSNGDFYPGAEDLCDDDLDQDCDGQDAPCATPTATPTETAAPTPTPGGEITPTFEATPSETATFEPTESQGESPSEEASPSGDTSPSETPSESPSPTFSENPTETEEAQTPTLESSPTPSPTPAPGTPEPTQVDGSPTEPSPSPGDGPDDAGCECNSSQGRPSVEWILAGMLLFLGRRRRN